MDKMLEVAFDGPVHRSSVNRDLADAAGQRTGRNARRAVHITECYVMAGLVAVTKPSKKRRMMMMMMRTVVLLLLLQSVAWPAKRRISNFALDRLVSHYKKLQFFSRPLLAPVVLVCFTFHYIPPASLISSHLIPCLFSCRCTFKCSHRAAGTTTTISVIEVMIVIDRSIMAALRSTRDLAGGGSTAGRPL